MLVLKINVQLITQKKRLLNLSWRKMARRCDITDPWLMKILSDPSRNVSLNIVSKIAHGLGISPKDLLIEVEDES